MSAHKAMREVNKRVHSITSTSKHTSTERHSGSDPSHPPTLQHMHSSPTTWELQENDICLCFLSMLPSVHHQGNANQTHNEIPLHTKQALRQAGLGPNLSTHFSAGQSGARDLTSPCGNLFTCNTTGKAASPPSPEAGYYMV